MYHAGGGGGIPHVNSRTFCATTTKPRRAENRYRSLALLLPRRGSHRFVSPARSLATRPGPMRCDARLPFDACRNDWFQRGREGSPNRKLLMPRERSPITSKLSTSRGFTSHRRRSDSSRKIFGPCSRGILRLSIECANSETAPISGYDLCYFRFTCSSLDRTDLSWADLIADAACLSRDFCSGGMKCWIEENNNELNLFALLSDLRYQASTKSTNRRGGRTYVVTFARGRLNYTIQMEKFIKWHFHWYPFFHSFVVPLIFDLISLILNQF